MRKVEREASAAMVPVNLVLRLIMNKGLQYDPER